MNFIPLPVTLALDRAELDLLLFLCFSSSYCPPDTGVYEPSVFGSFLLYHHHSLGELTQHGRTDIQLPKFAPFE